MGVQGPIIDLCAFPRHILTLVVVCGGAIFNGANSTRTAPGAPAGAGAGAAGVSVSVSSSSSGSVAEQRYSYLLLLLSKLKIENVALRSRLDKDTAGAVLADVAHAVRELP